MTWVKMDDRFPQHRKIRPLSDSAFRLDVSAWCWCSQYLTDGLVRVEDLRQVSDVRNPRKAAAELVRRGRWHTPGHDCPRCPAVEDGWVIHDYLTYNHSRDRALHVRETRARRQRRWVDTQKRRDATTSESNANDTTHDAPGASTHAHDDTHTDTSADASRGAPKIDSNAPQDSRIDASEDDSRDASRDTSRDDPLTPSVTHAPVPDPDPDPNYTPPVGRSRAAPPEPPTAQTLVGGWIDSCEKRPPQRVVGHVAREVAALLAEGIDPNDVQRGLAAWAERGLHPAVLASVVNEAMNASRRRPADTSRSRNAAILDAARRRAQEAEDGLR